MTLVACTRVHCRRMKGQLHLICLKGKGLSFLW